MGKARLFLTSPLEKRDPTGTADHQGLWRCFFSLYRVYVGAIASSDQPLRNILHIDTAAGVMLLARIQQGKLV